MRNFIEKGNFKGNYVIGNLKESYFSEETFKETETNLGDLSKVVTDLDNKEYSITIGGVKMPLEYEEACEILYALSSCRIGNESFPDAKIKANFMIENYLPVTSY
jgi:hypothetical protein